MEVSTGGKEFLEKVQNRILQRIDCVESLIPTQQQTTTTLPSPVNNSSNPGSENGSAGLRLSSILRSNRVSDFSFVYVPSNYYDVPLEDRRRILDAPSLDHLCKSIVLVNTQAPSHVMDCNNHLNSKYYIVVVQYAAKVNAEAVKNFLYTLNNGLIAKKKFNFRLAPEETSEQLTGYAHNAVTCVGMKTDIPVILDAAIAKLSPDFFWLGGGEVHLKLRIRTPQFINFVNPFIVSCSSSIP